MNKNESTPCQNLWSTTKIIEEILWLWIHLSENEKEIKLKSWALKEQVRKREWPQRDRME